jgi:protein ImuB
MLNAASTARRIVPAAIEKSGAEGRGIEGRRVAALWLRDFSLERSFNKFEFIEKIPLVLILNEAHRSRIFAANPTAQALGIAPGQMLADARALCPDLTLREADPAGDRRAIDRLAAWCGRYTPWVGLDGAAGPGEAGLFLDVTGCAHLLGGEAALLADLARRCARFGLAPRLALAETPGAAWAWARFRPGPASAILAPGEAATALRTLPVEGLRLPAATVEALRRLGLKRIGDLAVLPRAALAARFGNDLLHRLDQALGRAARSAAEPIAPRKPPTDFTVQRNFSEPVMMPEALGPILARLLSRLCRLLEREGRGARRLVFTLYRIDGTVTSAAIGTSLPARDPAHLAKLFAPRLDTLDPDPGIEAAALEAPETSPFRADQNNLLADNGGPSGLMPLIDRLANRLGADRVGYLAPRTLHLPERQSRFLPALASEESRDAADWSAWPAAAAPQPLSLYAKPEAVEIEMGEIEMGEIESTNIEAGKIEAGGAAPDAPPRAFLWRHRRHRVAAASGPDRRLGAWWQGDDTARDYWTVTDEAGRRLWLCRDLATGRWHVHGVLAPSDSPP